MRKYSYEFNNKKYDDFKQKEARRVGINSLSGILQQA